MTSPMYSHSAPVFKPLLTAMKKILLQASDHEEAHRAGLPVELRPAAVPVPRDHGLRHPAPQWSFHRQARFHGDLLGNVYAAFIGDGLLRQLFRRCSTLAFG